MVTERLHVGRSAFAVSAVNDSAQGKGHDRILCTRGFAGVADGATPLALDWPQDVGAFAAAALESLARLSREELTMQEVFQRAIVEVSAEFRVEEPFLSTGVAIVRAVGRDLEVATLGDCGALVVEGADVVQLQDQSLTRLDAAARASGPRQDQELVRNRRLMNRPEGYWIFARNHEAAQHVLVHRVPAEGVRAVLLYTDGYYRLVEPYRVLRNVEELLAAAEAGLSTTLTELRHHERVQPAGSGALSRADDASAVLLQRSNYGPASDALLADVER